MERTLRIQRVHINNFRNFQELNVVLGDHAVIVGENKVGKSNFLFALRLILDSSLPDSTRMLQPTDFWEGLGQPVPKEAVIHIAIDLIDFEYSHDLKSALADCLIEKEPFVARLNYVFRRILSGDGDEASPPKYEFLLYGANDEGRQIGYNQRRWMPLDLLQALRDAENDLSTFRRSPLQPLLKRAFAQIPQGELTAIAKAIGDAQEELSENAHIRDLDQRIVERLTTMTGPIHAIDTTLRVASTRPDALLRAIRLHIDGGVRDIGQASLGSANLLYIALKTLEIQEALDIEERHHSFFAIEEPEAHLHPHVQRLAYRHFLRPRYGQQVRDAQPLRQTILMTTHSPHIVSIAPLRSLVLLRRDRASNTTVAVSTANVSWTDAEVADIERYLEVTRGEMIFARGIMLVEGDAEEYIIPAFARLLGHDFDELGVSVCSISGIHFAPYIKLLGPEALNIPFAVITDYDPVNGDDPNNAQPPLGLARVRRLLAQFHSEDNIARMSDDECFAAGRRVGIFINQHTLEVDMFRAGSHEAICATIVELSENGAARRRAEGWRINPATLDTERFLSDINGISKGRFAQSLAGRLSAEHCPDYIRNAILHIINQDVQ